MANSKALAWTLAASILGAGVAGFVVLRVASRIATGDIEGLKAELPKELKAAKEEGFPMTPEELFPHRPVPDSKNAAKVVVRESSAIAKAFPTGHPASAAMANLFKGTATGGEKAALSNVVSANKSHLDAIIVGTRKDRCDFGKDYSEGYKLMFPEFAFLKSASKLLCARAQFAAASGNLSDVEDSLRASFQLARYAGQEPCLIGQLVKIAICAITHRSLRQMVFEYGKDARVLDMADRLLTRPIEPANLRLALRSEFVAGLIMINELQSMKDIEDMVGGSEPAIDLGPLNSMPSQMRTAWKVRHIQYWRRTFKRFPKDPHDFRAMGDVLREETSAEERQKSLDFIINRILLPAFDQAALACCKERADLAISRGFVALLRHRAKTGSFPQRSDQLSGSFIDGFDGKPLRYRRTDKGFVLYSIERDLKDDGGTKLSGNPKDGPGIDFGVEFP